jgi:pimeloyl-ACP methyl ester carboxylesterase
MESMAEQIPEATWFPVEGAGHISNLENPEQFNAALVAFLMSLS